MFTKEIKVNKSKKKDGIISPNSYNQIVKSIKENNNSNINNITTNYNEDKILNSENMEIFNAKPNKEHYIIKDNYVSSTNVKNSIPRPKSDKLINIIRNKTPEELRYKKYLDDDLVNINFSGTGNMLNSSIGISNSTLNK